MKKRNLLSLMLFAFCASVFIAQAQTAYPYFPESNVKGDLIPVATSVASPSTFVVDQSTDFTLEVNGTAGTLIRISNASTSYDYLPTSTGTIRFIKQGSIVYVYENAVYKTTIATIVNIPTIRQNVDDSTNKTGIYSTLNLIANPGFERRVYQGSATHFKDGVYWNAYNSSKALDWSTGTTAAIRSVSTTYSEGIYSIIMHSTTRYLTQKLPTLKPNTNYEISYDYWTSSPASNGGATYNILLGNSEFASDITSITGNTTSLTETTKKTFSGILRTPATITGANQWLTLYRSTSNVDWIDRVSLLEAIPTSAVAGIEGVTGTALYVAGTAYAPAVTLNLAAGDYFEMTQFITNPSFESAFTGWTNVGMATQTNTSFATFKNGNTYVEKYVGTTSLLPDASVTQTVTGLPNGTYTLKAAAQNLLQVPTPATGKPGAFIFGNTTQIAATDRAEYSFDFLVLNGKADIGFKLVSSQANWAAVDNYRLRYKGFVVQSIKDSLQALKDSATNLLGKTMQNAVRTALTTAIDAAQQAIDNTSISNADLAAVYVQLQSAVSSALISTVAYGDLQKGIDSATVIYGTGTGNGADSLLLAIQRNNLIVANLDAALASIYSGRDDIYFAIFKYKVANASGTVPTVVTNPFIARGATQAFGRSTVSGVVTTDILEQGFCWSTNPIPTVADNRTTKFFNRNGNIYRMENLQPSTVYYVRAYALTKNYAVGYGNVLKVITISKGTVTYQLNSSVVNSGENYPRIASAVASAVGYYNNLTSIKGQNLAVNYNAGTPTAEASYGGYMQIGAVASYQATGTVLHEMAHTIGVGQHSMWYGPSSPLRAGGTTGIWLGERANKLVKFLDNNTTSVMTGDAIHFWPYGINGSFEDDGTELLYCTNALIAQALGEDGLPPTGGFATPSYTFNQEDTLKYYIKIENENLGRNTSFLSESLTGQLVNKTISNTDVLMNDSSAWYFKFNPVSGYYQIRNAATGNYFTYQASGANGITSAPAATLAAANNFQLMGSRNITLIGTAANGYYAKSYWIVRPTATLNPAVLAANSPASTSVITIINRDTAISQRWLLLSKSDIDSIQRVMAVVLPVTITKFTAKAVAGEGLLEWSTATEINSRKFEIERSTNGINFNYIGEVSAAGNSTMTKDYHFTDKQPNTGNNFYRLKQVDLDGAFTYSAIAKINFDAAIANLWIIYPTITQSGKSTALYAKTAFNKMSISLVDLSGKVLSAQSLNMVSAGQKIDIPMLELAKGIYMIKIESEKGASAQKIFVQ